MNDKKLNTVLQNGGRKIQIQGLARVKAECYSGLKILNKMTKEDVPEKITLKERYKRIRRQNCGASLRKKSTEKEKLEQVSERLTSKFRNL